MQHAELSPSKRHRWAMCPGSIREEKSYPPDVSGPSAIDGTHSHTLLEYCVKTGLSDPTLTVGSVMKDHEGEFTVDNARAERVRVAIDYIKERVASFNGLAQVVSETRVDPYWFTHRNDLSGTVDVQIIGTDTLEIIDYKDGMGIVTAENNLQLEQYAIGKLAECKLGWNVPDQYPWKEVRMTIIQPKLIEKRMQPITTWIVPVKYLLDRVEVLISQARATDASDAPLVPGETQCKYCRAKGACSALANTVMQKTDMSFQSATNTHVYDLAQQSANKDPFTMTNDQLRQIIEAAPLMRQLIEAVENEAKRRIESGMTIPGIKLVNGRGSRKWAFSEDEMVQKLKKMGIPKTELYVSSLVSPAQLEKLKWKKRDGSEVRLSEHQLKRLNQEYIVTLAGKPTVVLDSDHRPAILTDASSMFSDVTPVPVWLQAK